MSLEPRVGSEVPILICRAWIRGSHCIRSIHEQGSAQLRKYRETGGAAMTADPVIQRVIDILCDYRHQRLATEDVDAVPDLEIIDLYAARVAGTEDYLVHVADGLVEEVAFENWPPERPRSRRSATKHGGPTSASPR
jgi:hypothetical protein